MSATDSDAFGRCKWCGNMTDSAGCLNITCASRTPPTPDPRERGEARAVVRQHAERMAGYVAQSYDEGRRWEELTRSGFWVGCIDNVLDALAALRAPAPSEAVGALNYLRECVDAMREGRDGDGVFSQKAYELLDELATHPAPARGVTVTEAIAERDAWWATKLRDTFNALPRYRMVKQSERRGKPPIIEFTYHDPERHKIDARAMDAAEVLEAIANLLRSALTPDAEGGA